MCDFDLQALDLFGELDPETKNKLKILKNRGQKLKVIPLRVGQRFSLLSDIPNIQDFAHKINDRLSFIKRGGRNVNIEHHFPLRGPNALMKPEPDFSAAAQGVVVPVRAGKEASAYRCVGHGGQVSHDYIQSLNSVKRNGSSTT